MKLKLLHQNINQRYVSNKTPTNIVADLTIQKADVIILSEFKKTPNYEEALKAPLEKEGYTVFLDPREYAGRLKAKINQILIAIKSNLVEHQDIIPKTLPDNREDIINGELGEYPNYLRVDIELLGIAYSIIGARIRVKEKSGTKEHEFRAKQFQLLLNELPKERKIIMLGDFNISPHQAFMKTGSKWRFDKNYEDLIKNRKLKLLVPLDGYSPFNSTWKLDHMIGSSELDIAAPEYFVKDSWLDKDKVKNYPDHSIIITHLNI